MVAAENQAGTILCSWIDSTDECKGADKTSAERAEDPFALLFVQAVETVPDGDTKIVPQPQPLF